MGKRIGPTFYYAAIMTGCVVLCFTATVALPDQTSATNSTAAASFDSKENKSALVNLALQSVQQLQEQQQSVLQTLEQLRKDSSATSHAIEAARVEADAATKRYTDAIAARLAMIELAITAPGATNSTMQLPEKLALNRAIEQTRQETTAAAAALEAARREADATAKKNSEMFQARLDEVERNVKERGQLELAAMQSAHRFTIFAIGIAVAIGFFGMLFFAVFALRALNRRDKMTGGLQPLGGYSSTALVPAGAQLVTLNPAEQSSARFINAIEQLEKRLQELEHTAAVPPHGMEGNGQAVSSADHSKVLAHGVPVDEGSPAPIQNKHADSAARVALLLGKGQALLNLQQADTALVCFDEVLALDPTNAEAFVKKGAALEKLSKLDEAIDCYDRAIALDHSITMAYLCKGGVFNRLERYGEALQCYEAALRANQETGVS